MWLNYFVCLSMGAVFGFIASSLLQANRDNRELMDYLEEIAREDVEE